METKLTDEQLAEIAWTDSNESTAALARRLGASYTAVYKIRRRMRRAGGWWCPLHCAICTECGLPLLCNAATILRTAHRSCERTRERRYQRQPGAILASQARDRRRRERDPERVTATFAHWKRVAQQELALTQARATQARTRWEEEDDALLWDLQGEPTREIALALGRSTGAVFARRHRLRHQHRSSA